MVSAAGMVRHISQLDFKITLLQLDLFLGDFHNLIILYNEKLFKWKV